MEKLGHFWLASLYCQGNLLLWPLLLAVCVCARVCMCLSALFDKGSLTACIENPVKQLIFMFFLLVSLQVL